MKYVLMIKFFNLITVRALIGWSVDAELEFVLELIDH